MFASPTRSTDGTIVGRWPFDAAVTSTETGCSRVDGLTPSLVLPPNSEIVPPVSVRSPSGVRPTQFSLIEPCMTVNGVMVDCILVDVNVLMVNPSSEVVVLPSFTCVETWSRYQQCA